MKSGLFRTPPYRKYRLPSFTGKLYLIQWNPERYTDLHGHDGKDCHFYILKGPLNESVYTKQKFNFEMKHINHHKKGDMGFINDSIGLHVIHNPCNKYKWSLNFYQ